MKALFDTNILIDFLNKVPEARIELHLHEQRAISIVSWIEVLVGTPADLDSATRRFLAEFELLQLTPEIAQGAVDSRRQQKIKLPDAIIRASAQANGMLLVTRNTKDFSSNDPGVRIPYQRH